MDMIKNIYLFSLKNWIKIALLLNKEDHYVQPKFFKLNHVCVQDKTTFMGQKNTFF